MSGCINVHYKDESNISFAWQVGLGAGYALTKKLTLDAAGYRYVDLGGFKTFMTKADGSASGVTSAEGDINAHEILLGLRWSF